jgi:hypothetical protein
MKLLGFRLKQVIQQMRQGSARLHRNSTSARRVLAFEHFEPRLALSTTQAAFVPVEGNYFTIREGGWIIADTSSFVVANLNGQGRGNPSSIFLYSHHADGVSSMFDGTPSTLGTNLSYDAASDLDDMPLMPAAIDTLSAGQGQVVTIPPPATGGVSSEGGPISLVAFTGTLGLGSQVSESANGLAKDGRAIKDPSLERSLVPARSAPNDVLRARAVVYEVAYSTPDQESRGELSRATSKTPASNVALADDAGVRSVDGRDVTILASHVSGRSSSVDRSVKTDGDVTGGKRSAEPVVLTAVSLRKPALAETNRKEIAAASTPSAVGREAPRISGEKNARDEAFELISTDAEAWPERKAAFADSSDNRHRKALGAVVLVALAAKPVSKKLRQRGSKVASELLPR